MARAEAGARRAGEAYHYADPTDPAAAAADGIVRERATTAGEFDPGEITRGAHAAALPPFGLAALPLVTVVLVNLIMSFGVLPRIDASFLGEAQWGTTSLAAVGGVWSVIVALAVAIVVLIATSFNRLPTLRATMDAGANAAVLPIISVASLVGFGAVVASFPPSKQ